MILPKQKEKIFSSKLKTCFADYNDNISIKKINPIISEQKAKNPFQIS